jgi:glyoxylate utilization-related uncharacterized protein
MTVFIDTKQCPRVELPGVGGAVAEIVNRELCGAENVVGMLRWLREGEKFAAERLAETHQLIYLMEGEGVINLENKNYDVAKGAGIYLGPNETARISQSGPATLKLLHLVAPKLPA